MEESFSQPLFEPQSIFVLLLCSQQLLLGMIQASSYLDCSHLASPW